MLARVVRLGDRLQHIELAGTLLIPVHRAERSADHKMAGGLFRIYTRRILMSRQMTGRPAVLELGKNISPGRIVYKRGRSHLSGHTEALCKLFKLIHIALRAFEADFVHSVTRNYVEMNMLDGLPRSFAVVLENIEAIGVKSRFDVRSDLLDALDKFGERFTRRIETPFGMSFRDYECMPFRKRIYIEICQAYLIFVNFERRNLALGDSAKNTIVFNIPIISFKVQSAKVVCSSLRTAPGPLSDSRKYFSIFSKRTVPVRSTPKTDAFAKIGLSWPE